MYPYCVYFRAMPKQLLASDSFHLRMPTELWRRGQKQAAKEQRTLSSLIRYLLVRYLDEKQKGQPA